MWKMLLSNKGLLPILWELFPDHPNLLPTFEDAAPLAGHYVRKPKLSREGSNVTWVEGGVAVEATDSGSPHELASASTGESPAHDTRFGSSNFTDTCAESCNACTYRMTP